MLVPLVRAVRRAPRSHPCPHCGRPGRRERPLHRRIRSRAYRRVAYLDVHCAESQARCSCRTSFRSWPLDVPPKADDDGRVRAAVPDRIPEDGLNVQRTLAAMKRDFRLKLSEGFGYDGLRGKIAQLDLAVHRQQVRARFSGTLCIDALPRGRFTLVLATDPLSDLPVGSALVSRNDPDHLRRSLRNLRLWGLAPSVIATDGAARSPAVRLELWPGARHPRCVFHRLVDISALILQAVRRLAHALRRRGQAGRTRRRGRPRKARQAARTAAGATLKEKAGFVLKHRSLVVKKASDRVKEQWESRTRMCAYRPELRTLWSFAGEVRGLCEKEARVQTLWKRRAALLRGDSSRAVPGLAEARALLEAGKFRKAVAFVYRPAAERVRTNNHVERSDRRSRFAEKLRYKWRRREWVLRFVLPVLDRWWSQVTQAEQEVTAGPEQSAVPSRAAG